MQPTYTCQEMKEGILWDLSTFPSKRLIPDLVKNMFANDSRWPMSSSDPCFTVSKLFNKGKIHSDHDCYSASGHDTNL